MAGINRTTILAGPCQIVFAGSTFWSKGDVTIKPVFDKFDIVTSSYGKVDTRTKGRKYTIDFEPDGRMMSALLTILWPYGSQAFGTSIFGTPGARGTDRPLNIYAADGILVSFSNAALTKVPTLRLGVGVTCAGSCQFTSLLANSTAVTASSAYVVVSTAAIPTVTTSTTVDNKWAAADILSGPALATWGSAPWAAFSVDNPGWEVDTNLQLSNVDVDHLGTVDMLLQGMEITAKATPVGPSVSDIITALRGSLEMGTSLSTAGTNLVITQGTTPKLLTATIYNAAMIDTGLAWSNSKKRIESCQWSACRTVTSGTADPLFALAIS